MSQNNSQFDEINYGVYPDSVKLGLSGNNTLVAVFKNKEHAEKFGKMLWGRFYEIEDFSKNSKIENENDKA